jgi:hypothetical protein
MQSPLLRPVGAHHHGPAGPPTPIFVGFPACGEALQSPSPFFDTPSQRRRSLLSDLLCDAQAALAQADAIMGGGDADMFDAAACHDDDDDDEDDEELDEEELGLLEALDAAWGSPSSSIFSTGTAATGASRASAASSTTAASSSRPIAIPASTYFKDQAQRAHLEKLNKKRQVCAGARATGGGDASPPLDRRPGRRMDTHGLRTAPRAMHAAPPAALQGPWCTVLAGGTRAPTPCPLVRTGPPLVSH